MNRGTVVKSPLGKPVCYDLHVQVKWHVVQLFQV